MKWYIRNTLLIAALLITSAASAQIAHDFCMDCAERTRPTLGGGSTTNALCCMSADSGFCAGGFFVVKANVGWHCTITYNSDGTSNCNDAAQDTGCDAGPGGGGGGDGDGGDPFNDCTNDGGCSAACASCTFP